MEHNFHGPSYTIGIEEELMIVDADSYGLVNAIESLLEDAADGEIKPELMESVLEISTNPAPNTAEAGEQLRRLRAQVRATAAGRGLAIGSAGTHPFAMWEDQRIVARARYRELVTALRFVARQELIFGMHVHVGVDDPDKAIHVANGMRVHLAVLLALSANSPFWRADATGLLSSRTPIFRTFPRVGIPPQYRDWAHWESEVGFMVASGVMEDYTWLWYDVRPHPNFGTVEVRVCDSQTRVEHTLALAALVQAMVKELCEHYEAGAALGDYPWQMLDENKWLAARHGLDGELVDLPSTERVATKALARRLVDRLREHAEDLGSAAELEAIDDLLARGNGAQRRLGLREALRELVAHAEHEAVQRLLGLGVDGVEPDAAAVADVAHDATARGHRAVAAGQVELHTDGTRQVLAVQQDAAGADVDGLHGLLRAGLGAVLGERRHEDRQRAVQAHEAPQLAGRHGVVDAEAGAHVVAAEQRAGEHDDLPVVL